MLNSNTTDSTFDLILSLRSVNCLILYLFPSSKLFGISCRTSFCPKTPCKKKRMYDISVTSMPKRWTWSSAILSGGSKRHACQAQKRAKKRCVEWLLPTLTLPCLFAHISWKRVPDWLTDFLFRIAERNGVEVNGTQRTLAWSLTNSECSHTMTLFIVLFCSPWLKTNIIQLGRLPPLAHSSLAQ